MKTLEETKLEYVKDVLLTHDRVAASNILGITYKTLTSYMKKLGISPGEVPASEPKISKELCIFPTNEERLSYLDNPRGK